MPRGFESPPATTLGSVAAAGAAAATASSKLASTGLHSDVMSNFLLVE